MKRPPTCEIEIQSCFYERKYMNKESRNPFIFKQGIDYFERNLKHLANLMFQRLVFDYTMLMEIKVLIKFIILVLSSSDKHHLEKEKSK